MTHAKPRQLLVLILRADRPKQEFFRWELRRAGMGLPMRSCEGVYSSIAEARLAGEIALAEFQSSQEMASQNSAGDAVGSANSGRGPFLTAS